MPWKRPVREQPAATPTDWAWLVGEEGANPWLGFVAEHQARLVQLWGHYEGEIRRLWETHPPERYPPGHPARPGSGWTILTPRRGAP